MRGSYGVLLAAALVAGAGCNGDVVIETPPGMVLVKNGSFIKGYNGPGATELEKDTQAVKVADFFLDIYEVTNADYLKFCKGSKNPFPPHWADKIAEGEFSDAAFGKLPVVNVAYGEAEAYAKSVGRRLPTEEEWEFAARGVDSKVFPWGNEFVKGNANIFEEGKKGPVAVGTYTAGKSVYSGTFDQAGNVWEWTSTMAAGTTKHYIKGGSFSALEDKPRSSLRGLAEATEKRPNLGFRCAKTYE